MPLWHPVYRESYSLEGLRDAAEQIAAEPGLWDALRAIARLAHAGCRAGDLRVTPFNGRLFAPARTPLAERRDLDDGAARRAIVALSTRPAPDGAGRERIAYRDLGVEQLGAVYETLLDYEPRVETGDGRRRALERRVRRPQGDRHVLHAAADRRLPRPPHARPARPRRRRPSRSSRLRIVDPAMGSGAFLVAACRYLASAYEAALVEAGGCHAERHRRSRARRRSGERSPSAASTASISTRWRSSSRGCRCGWRRSPPIGRSAFSIIACRPATACSARGSRSFAAAARGAAPRVHAAALPLFDDEAVVARAARRAADPFFARVRSRTTRWSRCGRRSGRSRALTARDAALSRWKRVARSVVRRVVRRSGGAAPAGGVRRAVGRACSPAAARCRRARRDAISSGRTRSASRARLLPLGARVSGSVLRRATARRLPTCRLRRGHRQPAVGHDSGGSRRGRRPLARERAATCAGDPLHARRRRLHRAVGRPRRTGISCSSSARSRSRAAAAGSAWCCRPGSRPITAARRCAGCCCRACDVDAIVGIDNQRGVFPIHRSVRFLLVTASPGRPTGEIACRLDLDDPADLEAIGDEASGARFPGAALAGAARAAFPDRPGAFPSLRSAIDLAIVERAAALFPPLGSRARAGRCSSAAS